MTAVAELYALQELDLALETARATVADIESRLHEPDELAEARQVAEEQREAARAAEKRFKECEFEADEAARKIQPLEVRLYQGTVRNPKELEDLQQDIDSLKRRRGVLEDEALAAMEALEAAQQVAREAARVLEELEQQHRAEQEDLAARADELAREIASLEQRRAEQVEAIDGALLRLYDTLASTRQGRAVAKIEGGACGGCRISLPMNVLQRARVGGAAPVQCSSCERILYVA